MELAESTGGMRVNKIIVGKGLEESSCDSIVCKRTDAIVKEQGTEHRTFASRLSQCPLRL